MTKRVAITGATGFVGRHLLRQCLVAGWQVRILSRNTQKARSISDKIEIFEGDLIDRNVNLAAFLAEQDVLIHCAGEIKDESKMPRLHVEGCQRLIEAASRRVKHWVHLSSVGVYGRPMVGLVTEESMQCPVSIYEQTKAQSDALVLAAAQKGAFEYSILRPSTVYGLDMPNQSLRSLICAVKKGRFFFIGKPGAQTYYIHVEDVAAAMVACIVNPNARNRIYILSHQCSIEELVMIIDATLKRNITYKRLPIGLAKLIASVCYILPGFPLTVSRVNALTTRVIYDNSKIARELQISPKISLCEGLRELVFAEI